MLAGRVLMVDGSVSQTLYPFMTTMQQEFICSELPVLHLHSLELLTAIVKGVRRCSTITNFPFVLLSILRFLLKCKFLSLIWYFLLFKMYKRSNTFNLVKRNRNKNKEIYFDFVDKGFNPELYNVMLSFKTGTFQLFHFLEKLVRRGKGL